MKKPNIITASMSPLAKILISFLLLILTGAALLLLPVSTFNGIRMVDALFTSTSAVCVTGLIVMDTAVDFTFFGQLVILLLIQFGGLGIMTFSIALLSLMGGSISMRWGLALRSLYSESNRLPVRNLLTRIVLYTVVIEGTAAAALYTQFIKKYEPGTALWHSAFQAVSAFCNAGFSTFSDSLMGYQTNGIVITIIALSIILGGLGFLVLHELANCSVKKGRSFFGQFTLHTRVVLALTTVFILFGMSLFLALEWNHILEGFSIKDKLGNAFFQSVTCRTAGFNTVETASLRESTLFLMMFLMFAGGAPGSIAGGIKITAMGVLAGLFIMKIRGRRQVVIWGRALDREAIDKSTTLFTLLAIEEGGGRPLFLPLLFESFSAFGTVGLSTGATPALSTAGKLIVCAVMYTGRLGPLTFIAALTWAKKGSVYELPEEHIMIG